MQRGRSPSFELFQLDMYVDGHMDKQITKLLDADLYTPNFK